MAAARDAPSAALSNDGIAAALEDLAALLEAQGSNPFRVRAYRHGAEALRALPRPAGEIVAEGGVEALRGRLGIGESLGRSIAQLAASGHLGLLDRLRGRRQPEDALTSVPGIGPKLAAAIHDELGIETLEDLEIAAHDGRLAALPGLGPRRVQGIRESLAGRFRHGPARPEARRPDPRPDEPPVAEVLDVDREYREGARRGKLPKIAPRRFNPSGEAWLPVLHAERGERHYTALFSNTARAHELGTTHDWVVVYRDDPGGDGRWTVVTGRLGALAGRRIVRGREAECLRHYGLLDTG